MRHDLISSSTAMNETTTSMRVPHCSTSTRKLARPSAASRRRTRQKRARLEEEQPRAYRDEIGKGVEVELLWLVEHRHVLVRDREQRDLGDVELLALDEEEEQVERPLEERKRELIRLMFGVR